MKTYLGAQAVEETDQALLWEGPRASAVSGNTDPLKR